MEGKFWLWLVAVVILGGIAVGILFLIVGAALATWGIFGSLLTFAAIALAIAWFYDRRKQHEYD